MKEKIERFQYRIRVVEADLRRFLLPGLIGNLYLISVSLYRRTDLTVIPEFLLTLLPVMTGMFLLMLFTMAHQHYLRESWRYPLKPRCMWDD